MPRPSNILRVLRAAAVCVLALVATVGPGLGVMAFADVVCHVGCCEDDVPVARFAKLEVDPCCPHHVASSKLESAGASELAGYSDVHSHESEEHSDSGQHCPDDCPSCHAGVGFALTMTPLLLPRVVLSTTQMSLMDASEMPPIAARNGIYRPPRTTA